MAYVRGDLPGVRRLKDILPSLFSYYKIITLDGQSKILSECGLWPIVMCGCADVTFYFNERSTVNPLKPRLSRSGIRMGGGDGTEVSYDNEEPFVDDEEPCVAAEGTLVA